MLFFEFGPLVDARSESGNIISIKLSHNILVVCTHVLCQPVTLVKVGESINVHSSLDWEAVTMLGSPSKG